MADLSPAAQAVLDATLGEGCVSWRDRRRIAAAALRAAADQPYEVPAYYRGDDYRTYRDGRTAERDHLCALANELEAL